MRISATLLTALVLLYETSLATTDETETQTIPEPDEGFVHIGTEYDWVVYFRDAGGKLAYQSYRGNSTFIVWGGFEVEEVRDPLKIDGLFEFEGELGYKIIVSEPPLPAFVPVGDLMRPTIPDPSAALAEFFVIGGKREQAYPEVRFAGRLDGNLVYIARMHSRSIDVWPSVGSPENQIEVPISEFVVSSRGEGRRYEAIGAEFDLWDLVNIGGKLAYKAKKHNQNKRVMVWGEEEIFETDLSISPPMNLDGDLVFILEKWTGRVDFRPDWAEIYLNGSQIGDRYEWVNGSDGNGVDEHSPQQAAGYLTLSPFGT